jgi:hypothetical protein
MKLSVVRFFNAYGFRELLLLLKYHSFFVAGKKNPMLISAIDDRRHTQGLTDRFKGIVTIYALSKALNVPFRCIFTHPFPLTDYLLPNKYNWLPQPDELSDSMHDVRYVILRKQPTLKRLMRLLPPKKQLWIYANYDYLKEINRTFNSNFRWGELFSELFRPTEELSLQIAKHISSITGEYIACVFRFQSLLGDFKEINSYSLPEDKQKELMKKNREALIRISLSSEMPVLVTSDSMKFIDSLKDVRNIYCFPGKVVHIDCAYGEHKEVYLKTFIDFFMLSSARKIYSVGTAQMYRTNFPAYAAKLRDIPFERILID